MLIRKVAEGITTYESNRNLVLTDGCRADSVPNLEIETGEIAGAGHASTTGRFDDEQLFYLRSRGIDEVEARRLVVHGFFADIIRRIGVPEIEARLLAAVEAELAVNVGPAVGAAAPTCRRPAPTRRGAPTASRARRAEARRVEAASASAALVTRLRRSPSLRVADVAPWLAVEVDGTDVAIVRSGDRVLRDRRRVLATPPSRCPRATSGTARSSATCTGRASTSAPGKPLGLPATEPVAVYPCRVDGDDVLVDLDAARRRRPALTTPSPRTPRSH